MVFARRDCGGLSLEHRRVPLLPVVNRRLPCDIVCPSVANLYHSDRLIIAFTSLNQSDKQWSAGAEITWKVDGVRRSHSISVLADRFKSSDDAERFVINLARAWIDANP